MIMLTSYGQKNIEISLQQDTRLLLVGDEKGNDPLSINLLSKIEFPVYQLEKNHLSTYFSMEYADLVGGSFQRYAIGAAYVVKRIYKKIGSVLYLDLGSIYRKSSNFFSLSVSGELNYKLNPNLKLIFSQQLSQRKDLEALYNSDKKYIVSGFVGVKYKL